MEEDNTIVVFQHFNNGIEANITKTKLDAFGVPCFLTEENLANLYPGNHALAFTVRLHVFEKDLARVREILEEDNIFIFDETAPSCPACKSKRLERDFPKKLSEQFLPGLKIIFFGIFFPQKKVFRCLECNNEFT